MQRCCSKLGRPLLSSRRLLLPPAAVSPHFHRPVAFPVNKSIPNTAPSAIHRLGLGFPHPSPRISNGFRHLQERHFAVKDRSRAPTTPVVSKLKKYKMKSYSSFKFRFRTMNDGKIRRWRAGKRHNAHSKSKISKRRLRRPETVHPAYAKVMKKLNFCG